MKVLFVGPYPPPHGGISVHVWSAHARMKQAGEQSSVLNVDPRAPASDAYIRISGGFGLARELVRHTFNDWVLHVHTNGHNAKSWWIALAGAVAAQLGPGAVLTLHSGFAPAYIRSSPEWMRRLIQVTCLLCRRVICVNHEIAGAIAELGIAREQIEITPAFLPIEAPEVALPAAIDTWMQEHSPLITSALFFRPEYGFELLLKAIGRLKARHPRIGCLVMGGEDPREAAALVARRKLTDAVLLAGDLDHELCLAAMARSDIFVRPTYRDADSIAVREALALSVPVVASSVGTRPDGVLLFEAGNVDELVERIERLMKPEATAYSAQNDAEQKDRKTQRRTATLK